MSAPLYELAARYEALVERAINIDTGEVIDEHLVKLLDELEGERDAKALDISCYVVELEAEATKIAMRAGQLSKRVQACRNRADSLRSYLTQHLPVGTKLRDDRVALAVTPGVEHVNVTSIDALPEQYKHTMVVPEKLELARVLKAGGVVSGAELERGLPSVRIR